MDCNSFEVELSMVQNDNVVEIGRILKIDRINQKCRPLACPSKHHWYHSYHRDHDIFENPGSSRVAEVTKSACCPYIRVLKGSKKRRKKKQNPPTIPDLWPSALKRDCTHSGGFPFTPNIVKKSGSGKMDFTECLWIPTQRHYLCLQDITITK